MTLWYSVFPGYMNGVNGEYRMALDIISLERVGKEDSWLWPLHIHSPQEIHFQHAALDALQDEETLLMFRFVSTL